MKDLNQRPMKGYGGLSRAELFAQLDQPALSPLPAYTYEYSEFKYAKVAKEAPLQTAGQDEFVLSFLLFN